MLVAHLLSAVRLDRWEDEGDGCMKKGKEAGTNLRGIFQKRKAQKAFKLVFFFLQH